MAHVRQVATTSQRRQMAFAFSIWRSAGPVFPIGKNSSGSSPMQVARWRHVIRIRLLESKSGRSASSESAQAADRSATQVVQVDVKVNAKVNAKVNVQNHEKCAHSQSESDGRGCRPVARRVHLPHRCQDPKSTHLQ